MGTKNPNPGTVKLGNQKRMLNKEFGMMSTALNKGSLEATVKDSSWNRFQEFVDEQLSVEVVEHDYLGNGQTRVTME